MGSNLLSSDEKPISSMVKVVWTNGCFDLLHAGHLHILKESRQLGDKLVVGLNTDEAVRKLKGPDRPKKKYRFRRQALLNTGLVDEVIPIGVSPIDGIIDTKPDIITKGDDYKESEVIGHEYAEVRIIRRLPGHSTTRLVSTRKT